MNNTGKYIAAGVIVVGLGGYLIWSSQNSGTAVTPSVPAPVVDNTPSTTPAGGMTPTGTSTATGAFKDGTYTGPVTDAYYGNLQVAAVIKGGKLVDVKALQYPSDQGTSREISASSLPKLTQEAISSQSANVNIVSGATQTSEAFQQSLKAALLAAKA